MSLKEMIKTRREASKDKEPREETQASKKTLDEIFNAHFGALK